MLSQNNGDPEKRDWLIGAGTAAAAAAATGGGSAPVTPRGSRRRATPKEFARQVRKGLAKLSADASASSVQAAGGGAAKSKCNARRACLLCPDARSPANPDARSPAPPEPPPAVVGVDRGQWSADYFVVSKQMAKPLRYKHELNVQATLQARGLRDKRELKRKAGAAAAPSSPPTVPLTTNGGGEASPSPLSPRSEGGDDLFQ